MLFASVVFLASCDMEIEKAKLAPLSGFQAPELYPQGPVLVNGDNNKTESVTFNWTRASFGAPVQIEYSLYLTANDKVVLAGLSFANSLTMTKSDLNGLVCNDLGVSPNETIGVTAYLQAKVYGTKTESVTSNSVAFNVTTYAAELRSLFMPGNYQGWNIEQAPQFWETGGGTNIYNTLTDLEDGSDQYSYFKITVARNWSDANWGYNALTPSWFCPEQSDSNLSVDLTEGSINLISVNRGKMTIDRTHVENVGMCGAFDKWSYATNGDLPFVYDATENVWTSSAVTFNDADGLGFLVRLNTLTNRENWDDKYGTDNESDPAVPGGLKLVKGGGDIKVPSAGTYIMKLHGNRTPFVLVMEKQ